MSMTRRHMLASGAGLAAAGSAAVLTGCGTEGREARTTERDVELLQEALTAQATLAELYAIAADQPLGDRVADAVEAFSEQAREHVALLGERIADAGGTPDDAPASPPQAESAVEALRMALDGAVAACHDIVGALSTVAARRSVYRVMIASSGQLAVLRGVLGEQQVPVAFVTGKAEPPLAVDPDTGAHPEGDR